MSAIPDIELDLKPSRKRTERVSGLVDSGIPWIGHAPRSWAIKRLRWTILSARNGIWGAEPDGENDIPCVRVADFDRVSFRVSGEVPTLRSVTPSERRGRVLEKGDLLLEKSGGGELQPVGAVAIYDSGVPAVCSNFLARLVASPDCDSRFLSYLHAHLYSARVNIRSIKQTTGIQNLDAYSYFCEPVPVPPLEEQRAIAAFLDRETAKIDELIAKKQRLRLILAEIQSRQVSLAVCQGLRSEPSGVSSLGFPRSWMVGKLRWYCRSIRDGTHNPPPRATGPYRLLSVRNVVDGKFVLLDDDRTMDEDAFNELQRSYTVEKGDVVLAIVGATTGKSAVVEEMENVTVQRSLAILRPRRVLNSNFLNYWIQSSVLQSQIRETANKYAAQPGIYLDEVAELAVPVPSLEEQEEIVGFLDRRCAELCGLATRIGEGIAKLTTYRAGLISAAVTGQIDVRHYRDDSLGAVEEAAL